MILIRQFNRFSNNKKCSQEARKVSMDMLEWMTNLHKNGTNVGMDYQSTQERYKRWDG